MKLFATQHSAACMDQILSLSHQATLNESSGPECNGRDERHPITSRPINPVALQHCHVQAGGKPMTDAAESRRVRTGRTEIALDVIGRGPPVLLLHGCPQTRLIWRHVAPLLAARWTLVAADLIGYGESGKPASDPTHLAHSERFVAADMVEAMAALGHERFAVVGHDRGGRVAHRMCLDHADRVTRAAVLDIVPTRTIYRATDQAIATSYFHWFFLIQP